ncbi:hypothetical protein PO883_09650 [Massilia sp. DJPM01]|uniref:hypothetical protein n=1 Tax=Massilia sp. DJPM01 TaxID=3024404 RepID=UPI00259F6E51|nr:hypothetical protein [Massilia sp. DJPM01]MDM5177454.1 hypothetical protein [Massilia sp. DJPM01]
MSTMVSMMVGVFFLHIRFGPAIYFLLGSAIGPAIFLAVAGKGNRWLGAGIIVLLNGLAYLAVVSGFAARINYMDGGFAAGMLACILVPLFPAALLWLAHTLAVRRRAR